MVGVLAVLFFLSGASALIYQVVWLRMLSLVFGVTVYAASTVLASFMAGLAIGSGAAGGIADRVRSPLRWFGIAEILIALSALLSPFALDLVRDAYVALGPAENRTSTPRLARLVLSALVLLPPTMLMGATLPFVLRSSFVDAAGIGARVSLLYGVNTAGAIAGALVAGFILIGSIGMSGALRVAASLNVVVGAAALVLSKVTAGRVETRSIALSQMRPSRRDAAPSLVLAVFAVSGFVSLALEVIWFRTLVLYYPATTYAFTAMLATVLAGIALGSWLAAPMSVDVVELAPGVVRAAEWFTHVNGDVLRKPNVRLRLDDGRNYMLLTRERYDVITADVIQPTHAGAGLLYSQEYFRIARGVLGDGGVMVQWVGPRSDVHYRLIARTFQSVFPETSVWINGSVLVGSIRPLPTDPASLARRFSDPSLREALASAGFPDVPTLLANFTAGSDELRAFLGPGRVLTDDKPLLEYYLSVQTADRPLDLIQLQRRR